MNRIILFLTLALAAGAHAQEEFSFQLYFEDAMGNKDTVTIGYDPAATDSIDPQFGEVNIISQPWGNSLDVRIGDKTYEGPPWNFDWLTQNTYLTKKQILSSVYCNSFEKKSSWISIQFDTDYLPIRIKWNGSNFIDDCRSESSLFGGTTSLGTDTFHGTPLAWINGDSMVIDLYTNEYHPEEKLGVYMYNIFFYSIQYYVENLDTIGIIQFYFWGDDGLGINKLENKSNIQIYPNPFDTHVEVNNLPLDAELKITDLNGQIIDIERIGNTLKTEILNGGLYILCVKHKENISYYKIIKN
jgi:hypothetical protein